MFKTLWFGVKRPDICNIVTISSSTIRKRRITNFNASFQGFISIWRKIHISVTRVTLPYQLMFEIIPRENKLDNIFSPLQHIIQISMIDFRAVTHVLIKNSVCIMYLIIALKIEEFYIFLTHCTKLTKNHENKFASSIKMFFPNT